MTGAVGVVGAAGAAAVSIGWTVTTNKDGDIMDLSPLNKVSIE